MARGSAPQHAVDEPLGAEPQKAQSALVTALLLSLQSIGGRWAEVALPPRKLLASLPRAPPACWSCSCANCSFWKLEYFQWVFALWVFSNAKQEESPEFIYLHFKLNTNLKS